MDKILEEAGLSTLLPRFNDERIEPELIVAMTDAELTRLGVTTIGDRVRLRSICRKKKDIYTENESTSSTNAVAPSSSDAVASSSVSLAGSSDVVSAASVAMERARLFNPRYSRNLSRKRKATVGANRTWTAQFFCLADRNQSKIPNASTKQILHNAGLGLKKIKLHLNDSEEQVAEKILSANLNEENETLGFPQLRDGGGFELLQCLSNCRQLSLISCQWSVKELKANLGAQSKIYIRPIQHNLSTKSIQTQNTVKVKQTCNGCQKEFFMCELRGHLYSCSAGLNDESDESDDNATSNNENIHNGEDININHGHLSHSNISNDFGITDATLPLGDTNNDQVYDITVPIISQNNLPVENQHVTILEPQELDDNIQVVSAVDANEAIIDIDVNSIIEDVVKMCKENNITSTKEVIRLMQSKVVQGRSLEIESVDTCPEGSTNYILVDRYHILDTGMEQINGLENPFLTLDVQFYGEVVLLL